MNRDKQGRFAKATSSIIKWIAWYVFFGAVINWFVDKVGQYGLKHKVGVVKTGFFLSAIAGGLSFQAYIQANAYFTAPELTYQAPMQRIVEIAHADVTPQEDKIEKAKNKVVQEVADCETGTVPASKREQFIKNDPGRKTNDENHQSYGWLQFKIGTVKAYVKKFEGRDITNLEAMGIAMNYQKSSDLAKRIMFEEKGGSSNWFHCSAKLGTEAQVKLIQSVE